MPNDDHLMNLIGAFVTAVGDDLRAALEQDAGSGGAYPAALIALDTWPDRSVDFLARVSGLTHPGAVRLADRLVASGLVEKGPGPDGRTAALRLTPKGRALARRARKSRARVLEPLTHGLTASERKALERALDRVLRAKPRSRMDARRACRLCDHSVCRGDSCPIGMSVEGAHHAST